MIYNSSYIINQLNKSKNTDKQFTIGSESELISLIKSHAPNLDTKLLEAYSDIRLKFAEHMRLDSIVFLFGNGSSLYAGSQETKSFSISEYSKQAKYKTLKNTIEKINQFLGIEDQLNALLIASAYYHLINDRKMSVADQLINDVKEDLISNFVNSIDYRKLDIHEIMLRKLRSFECLSRTSIYTLNYDLAFEYSFDKLGIEYKDGFSGFVNRLFDPKNLDSKGIPSLIKIHGSVNWLSNDNEIKEFQPQFEDGKVKIPKDTPVLIYPTSHKLYQTYTSPYSELMRHMLDELESSRNVVIVLGYKYGDEHINEILHKALKNPHNIFYFFAYSYNETNVFLSKIINIADTMPNVNYFEGKVLADFSNFVKYMLPATPEKTDQEKVIELLGKVLKNNG